MRCAVVTSVRNGEHLIADTIDSICRQTAVLAGEVSVRYHIQDGGSTDATVRIAEAAAESAPQGVELSIASSSDKGLYDGLASAFDNMPAADWYCYLNAGDLWDPRALEVLMSFVSMTPVEWVCGLHAYFSAQGSLVHTRLPYRYHPDLIRAGAYGRGLPTIQQESTFWSKSLQDLIDFDRFRTFLVAGDFYLWWTFGRVAEPSILQALLGGFRYHGDHLGHSKEEYQHEMKSLAGPLSLRTRVRIAEQLPLWEQPSRLKAQMNPNLYLYQPGLNTWESRRKDSVARSPF